MASISIVIPTHDRPACLRRLLEALATQTTAPTEVLVVSDGAVEPESLDHLRTAGVSTRVIRIDSPSSSIGRNAGLAAADGDIVLCLDDDMIPAPDLLARLRELYAMDRLRRVAGIGVPYDEANRTPAWRWWEWAFRCLGRVRWRPRRIAARYVRLPAGLGNQLAPADMLPGGVMSLRRDVARVARFDETFQGYAFGEDRELSYRLGRDHALFLARRFRVTHAPGETGRGDWTTRGRTYVDNVLHIVKTSVDDGAGARLLVAMDFVGAFVQHVAWALATRKRHNLDFALGLAGALLRRGVRAIKETLCGR
jgi:glycosyltransferase involved in cell wall biosynthesis